MKVITLDNKNTQRYGGFKIYFELYFKALKMYKNTPNVKFKDKLILYLSFIWFCLIKPLGQFISVITYLKGTYKLYNGNFENVDLKKTIEYRLFGIPLWFKYNCEILKSDLE